MQREKDILRGTRISHLLLSACDILSHSDYPCKKKRNPKHQLSIDYDGNIINQIPIRFICEIIAQN